MKNAERLAYISDKLEKRIAAIEERLAQFEIDTHGNVVTREVEIQLPSLKEQAQ